MSITELEPIFCGFSVSQRCWWSFSKQRECAMNAYIVAKISSPKHLVPLLKAKSFKCLPWLHYLHFLFPMHERCFCVCTLPSLSHSSHWSESIIEPKQERTLHVLVQVLLGRPNLTRLMDCLITFIDHTFLMYICIYIYFF